jgi:calmodulin
MVELTEE